MSEGRLEAWVKRLLPKPEQERDIRRRDTISGTANDWNSYDDNNWAGVRTTEKVTEISPF